MQVTVHRVQQTENLHAADGTHLLLLQGLELRIQLLQALAGILGQLLGLLQNRLKLLFHLLKVLADIILGELKVCGKAYLMMRAAALRPQEATPLRRGPNSLGLGSAVLAISH